MWKLKGDLGTIVYMGENVCTAVLDNGTTKTFPISDLPIWVEKLKIFADDNGGISVGEWNE